MTLIKEEKFNIGDYVYCLSNPKNNKHNNIITEGRIVKKYTYYGIYYNTLDRYIEDRIVLDKGQDIEISNFITKKHFIK